MKRIFLFVILALSSVSVFSQNEADIFESLSDQTDVSKGKVKITQDERLKLVVAEKKMRDAEARPYTLRQGFRVQIFSSNEQRMAKAKAYQVETIMHERLPQYLVYVSYVSPFWKVRVGDCITRSSAKRLCDEVRKALPEYKETYIVPDQVRVPIYE